MKHQLHTLFVLSAFMLLSSCGNIAGSSQISENTSNSPINTSQQGETNTGEQEHSSKEESASSTIDSKDESIDDSSKTSFEDSSTEEQTSSTSIEDSSLVSSEEITSADSEDGSSTSSLSTEVTQSDDNGSFSISTADGAFSKSGSIYTISSYGTYSLSGTLVGQIYVDVAETEEGESTVELDLNGVDISFGDNSPIYILSADEVKIKAEKKTTNKITDLRELESVEDEAQGNGAIYAKADLKLVGKGSLEVTGTYNNGIHTTKDLKIKNQTLKVTAPNNAIKGNDSLTIESGDITAISTGGDALKSSNTDISSSGKQRGNINITGGDIKLYSACDGIDAAYDAVISEGLDEDNNVTIPNVTILTNKFSDYTGDIVSSSEEKFYLCTTTSNSSSYRYSVYFYNDTLDNGVWEDATYLTSRTGGRGSTYYYYELNRPASYNSFQIYKFSSTSENSLTNYIAKSSGNTVNTNYDMVTFSGTTSLSISKWGNYGSSSGGPGGGGFGPGGGGGPGGQGQSNTNKADSSAKGIKAANTVQISGGSINIKAYDDGIHANYGETLENGSKGAGDVLISGGNTQIYATDDGIRADRYLRIFGGDIKVSYSYEGLEGNQIYISGGSSDIFGTDDAVNAGNSSNTAGLSAQINISGGYLFCAVPSSGDTDGLDSNGSITQTGGVVITCGPSSGMASALDADGTVSIKGGTMVVFGGYESAPSTSGVTSSNLSGTYGNGNTYTLNYNSSAIQTKAFPSYSYRNAYSWSEYGALKSVN